VGEGREGLTAQLLARHARARARARARVACYMVVVCGVPHGRDLNISGRPRR